MIETFPKRKVGHPSAPLTAEETRQWISRETVNKSREHRLRWLYKLLRAFVQAEQHRRDDARLAALNEANRLKQEATDLQRREYQRRYEQSEGGIAVLNLRRENEKLQRRIAVLEAGREQ